MTDQLIQPESLEIAARAAFAEWDHEVPGFHPWEEERDAFVKTARTVITAWCEAEGITAAQTPGVLAATEIHHHYPNVPHNPDRLEVRLKVGTRVRRAKLHATSPDVTGQIVGWDEDLKAPLVLWDGHHGLGKEAVYHGEYEVLTMPQTAREMMDRLDHKLEDLVTDEDVNRDYDEPVDTGEPPNDAPREGMIVRED